MPEIRMIGDHYDKHDQFSDDGCVIECHGISFEDAESQGGFMKSYECGDRFRDGVIVDCFCHPESDCIWAIVKCNDVYFSVEFKHTGKYDIFNEPLPFK